MSVLGAVPSREVYLWGVYQAYQPPQRGPGTRHTHPASSVQNDKNYYLPQLRSREVISNFISAHVTVAKFLILPCTYDIDQDLIHLGAISW